MSPIAFHPAAHAPSGGKGRPAEPERIASLGTKIRELADEFIKVFIIVMFIKMFFVEHYKIPTGSMTPTLLGGTVAFVDVNGDKAKDLVYWTDPQGAPLVFLRRGDRYLVDPQLRVDPMQVEQWRQAGLIHQEYDHILVNRMAYWFHPPRRGNIVVFKVPPSIFSLEAPIYIKRLVGEPGDDLTFTYDGRLVANGKLVTKPDFFQTQRYVTAPPGLAEYAPQPNVRYQTVGPMMRKIDAIHVPEGKAYVFGDNTHGSLDSRYWGGVPLDNFKGRAFLRIWPLGQFKFLR